MPYPHLTLVVRRRLFRSVGEFDLSYKIGMDYEWVCGLLDARARLAILNRRIRYAVEKALQRSDSRR